MVLVGPAAHEGLDPHRVLPDAEQGVGRQLPLAGQFHDQTGQAAVGAVMPGVVKAVLDQRVLDQAPDPIGRLAGVANARTPRRMVQRRGW